VWYGVNEMLQEIQIRVKIGRIPLKTIFSITTPYVHTVLSRFNPGKPNSKMDSETSSCGLVSESAYFSWEKNSGPIRMSSPMLGVVNMCSTHAIASWKNRKTKEIDWQVLW